MLSTYVYVYVYVLVCGDQHTRTTKVDSIVAVGDAIDVRVIEVDPSGRKVGGRARSRVITTTVSFLWQCITRLCLPLLCVFCARTRS
jgi:hypothetical protein